MLARLSLIALVAALLAGPALAKEKTRAGAANEAIECAGVYGPDSSEALVKETFGAKNVVTGMVYGAEGMEMLATTVFPDDPDRKMEFGWYDEENLSRLSYVELAPGQIAPGGVSIGMSVADVVNTNGADFEVGGFWWDYGGYANIETGALAGTQDGGCHVSIRFSPVDGYPEDIDVTSVAGEVQVPSSEPLLEAIDTRVQILSLSYPWPDDLPQPEY
jgi:hypothetical protein